LAADDKRPKRRFDRRARLDIVRSGEGFIMTIGPVFLCLDREAAEELMCLLADALEPGDPLGVIPTDSN
jgi:hypothetical protein